LADENHAQVGLISAYSMRLVLTLKKKHRFMMQELIFHIGGQQSVKEIQDWFSLQFPYLRINFFENI